MQQWRNRNHGYMRKEYSYWSEKRNIREYPSYQKPKHVSKYNEYWAWDWDLDVRDVSRSWKDQSKRRHQYKVKDI